MKNTRPTRLAALALTRLAVVLPVSLALTALGTVRYVDVGGTNATPPYTNWATAAHNIQEAVDASVAGDEIVVTNGLYATGGRAVDGTMTNRVAVDRAVTLRSVNGPEATVIQGYQVPETTNGDGAIRCVYLTYGAVLSGFTLTNGHTRGWEGDNNQRTGGGCRGGTLTNCILISNSATGDGGGASHATLYDCNLIGNRAGDDGGGTDTCTLYRCVLRGNTAENNGGGASESTLYNCLVVTNFCGPNEPEGGGVYKCVLYNCALMGNQSKRDGGGAFGSTLYNCTLTGNKASGAGGGAANCYLYNCTLTGNKAGRGGGVSGYGELLYNCIVYHNQAQVGPNYDDVSFNHVSFNYSCTTPLPQSGVGNIASDPQLASWTHLSSGSPCIAAGSTLYATGMDIDGEPWSNPPCIGADQLVPGAANSLLSVTLETDFPQVTVGFAAYFRAQVEGQTTGNQWDFADGARLTNRLEAVHAWVTPGSYPVRLTAFNDAHPDGVTATVTVEVVEVPVFHVNPANANPAFPYTTWPTAATNIQDAIGASPVAGRLVLVTNGIYDTGGVAVWGEMTNRIALTDGVVVRGVNGPGVTILRGAPALGGTNGDGAIRCAYVGDGCLLDGFTLTNGHTRMDGHNSREQGGGGAWCEQRGVVTNCVFVGNEAFLDGGGANGGIFYACTFRDNRAWDDSGGVDDAALYGCILTGNQAAGNGGGASECTLNNCTFTGNSAYAGGGAWNSTLNNCTLTGNSAEEGGGASSGTLNNCTLTGNSAGEGGGSWSGTLNNCTLSSNRGVWGGGAFLGTLNNCTLTGNSAWYGGGAVFGTLNNCTLVNNLARDSGGGVAYSGLANSIVAYNASWTDANHTDSILDYCCTTPLPTGGRGNIAVPPRFVDFAGGNLRMQPDSPCINAGFNAYAPGPTDMDGNPRISSDTVDLGAYEVQGPGSVISYAWLQGYGLPTDGSADTADPDGDRLNNWQEWRCGTDPTNALSVLRLLPPVPMGKDAIVRWQSVSNRVYFLERSTNLAASPSFLPLAMNLTGQAGSTAYTVTNSASEPPSFYRVGVPAP